MLKTINNKEYAAPEFEFVLQGESDSVFFVASGESPTPTLTGSIKSMTSANGSW